MPTYRDEAVVLRTHQLGEADRIVSLMTRQHGKVRAVAKGIRRTSSKFGSRLEPFSHVDIQFAEGRGSLEVVTQVETLHPGLMGEDYRLFTAAEVIVEAAERVVSEDGAPALPQYRLLLGALLALRSPGRDPLDVVDSYLLRCLATAGWAVTLDACVSCGVVDGPGWFSVQGGGAVCPRCKPASAVRLEPEVGRHLAALVSGDWPTVAAGGGDVGRRAHGIVVAYAAWHMDRGLRSLAFLER